MTSNIIERLCCDRCRRHEEFSIHETVPEENISKTAYKTGWRWIDVYSPTPYKHHYCPECAIEFTNWMTYQNFNLDVKLNEIEQYLESHTFKFDNDVKIEKVIQRCFDIIHRLIPFVNFHRMNYSIASLNRITTFVTDLDKFFEDRRKDEHERWREERLNEQKRWIEPFINECCEVRFDYKIEIQILYRTWLDYCKGKESEGNLDNIWQFGSAFKNVFNEDVKIGRKYIHGVRLRNSEGSIEITGQAQKRSSTVYKAALKELKLID